MDMSQYLEMFIDESKENLQTMNSIMLVLENESDNMQHLNDIFRIAHTLKGMSGTMGFTKVAELTHKMENLLDLVRGGKLPVTSSIVDILFECFDALESYIDNLEKTGTEGDLDTTQLVNKLIKIAQGDMSEAAPSTKTETVVEAKTKLESDFQVSADGIEGLFSQIEESGQHIHKIRVTISKESLLKAARAFIVFSTLEGLGEIVNSYPSAEEIEDERFDQSFELLYITKMDESSVKSELLKISEVDDVVVETVNLEPQANGPKPDVEVPLPKTDESAALKPKAKETPKVEQKTDAKNDAKTTKTVRVEIGRLDNLMNLVSELIIIKTRLEDQGNKQNETEAIEYLERITTSLHDAVMKVRMVPVERTFNRFPRLVRDLSRDLGKNIKLFMSGEETEVDRTVIDEIGDPLIHLIRNSLDHGIETPEERALTSKNPQGFVALRAYPDGNTVVIEVEDDGKGINANKIKNVALEKGIIKQSDADTMSDYEAINLLFAPGFSTAKEVTDLSGRGVGLDVVKTKIEAINGTVEVRTVLGEGSKFIIRLPLTLAIIQALMVNLGDEKFAIPLNTIKEITSITENSISMLQDQEVILYRNKTLPIVRMAEVLEVPGGAKPDGDELTVVIVKKGEIEAGLIVDHLIGQQEIVIKSLGHYLNGVRAIAGATILGNGSVALIIDPNQLI